MTALKISNQLSLPIDAATQTFAFIARKGAGKTYAAGKLAECLLDANVQVVVLDSVGNWWGLRLTASGKESAYDIPVIGGLRGDIPLQATGGNLIADIIVDTGRSLIIDVSQFSKGDRQRFATDLGERLWLKKKAERHPSPVHLIMEESQLIVPEAVRGDSARMVGIYEEIIRLGRNYGIGISMISQRPQSVNKEVLNQTECLFVLQVNGAHERKALREWIVYHGVDRTLVDELPSLPIGTAYVWSPQWLNILKKVEIGAKKTFDSSATPKVGSQQVRRDLKPLDLHDLETRMAATIERAKAEDPRELRREIGELRRQLVAALKPIEQADSVKRVEVPVLKDSQIRTLANILEKSTREIESHARKVGEFYQGLARTTKEICDAIRSASRSPMMRGSSKVERRFVKPTAVGSSPARAANLNGDEKLGKCETAILATLAQHGECDIHRLAVLSGYRKSGGFRNSVGKLRTLGYLDGPNTGVMRITDAGLKVGEFDALPMGRELFNYWLNSPRMGVCERKIMEVLDGRKNGLTLEEIAEASEYAISGGFRNSVGKLRTAGVIVGRNTERMRLNEEML